MTDRPSNTDGWLTRIILVVLSGLLLPFSALAATPGATTPAFQSSDGERRIAALHAPESSSSHRLPQRLREQQPGGDLSNARRILLDLQDFVENATTIVELDDRLKVGRMENERLRRSLLSNQAARNAFESQIRPSETIVEALTKTVVRNWLETVRVKHRFEKAGQELHASKASWLDLERRVADLRKALRARRAELNALRTERTALNVELGRLRQEVDRTERGTRQFERDQDQLSNISDTLRRHVAAGLRQILLESGRY